MDLNEAMKIANILEQDDVISPVALACRTLAEHIIRLLQPEVKETANEQTL